MRNTDQVFCAMSLFWDLMCISLMITLGWCILGRKITKAKYHFYHILSRIHTMNMAYHWWYWTWSADWGDVCWDSPLRSYSLFFLSMSYSLKWSHICSPNLRSRELNSLLWGQSINVNYLEFCIKALSLLSHLLFILSLCHYGLMDTYFIILVMIQRHFYSFYYLTCSCFDHCPWQSYYKYSHAK